MSYRDKTVASGRGCTQHWAQLLGPLRRPPLAVPSRTFARVEAALLPLGMNSACRTDEGLEACRSSCHSQPRPPPDLQLGPGNYPRRVTFAGSWKLSQTCCFGWALFSQQRVGDGGNREEA